MQIMVVPRGLYDAALKKKVMDMTVDDDDMVSLIINGESVSARIPFASCCSKESVFEAFYKFVSTENGAECGIKLFNLLSKCNLKYGLTNSDFLSIYRDEKSDKDKDKKQSDDDFDDEDIVEREVELLFFDSDLVSLSLRNYATAKACLFGLYFPADFAATFVLNFVNGRFACDVTINVHFEYRGSQGIVGIYHGGAERPMCFRKYIDGDDLLPLQLLGRPDKVRDMVYDVLGGDFDEQRF